MEKVDPGPVKLVVKASNQQFDDQIIECQTTWSVLKLKEHLSEVYPCKPAIPEQKLIYHGQLLKDKSFLQDILRTYDDVEPTNHIFHLVYTPKQHTDNNLSKQPAIDGLRQRNVQRNNGASSIVLNHPLTANGNNSTGNSTNNNGIPSINIPQMMANGSSNCPSSGHYPNGNLLAQQMAMQNWQQVYAQYMNQYMNLLSVGVRPETFFMQNQMPSQSSTSSYASGVLGFGGVMPPQLPLNQPNFPFGAGVSSQNLFQQNIPEPIVDNQQQGQQPQVPGGSDVGDGAVGGVAVPAGDGQPVQQPAPARFPQIVQEEQEHRDWLDTFYSFSRLAVLLTLVYFYSSPLRCLSVLFIAIGIYMYHMGYFRNQINGPAEANNINNNNNNNFNNNNNNNVQPAADGNVQENQPPAEVGAAAAGTGAGQASDNNESTSSNLLPETENNGTSVIAFVRTFVVTFFTSLLPETPAL